MGAQVNKESALDEKGQAVTPPSSPPSPTDSLINIEDLKSYKLPDGSVKLGTDIKRDMNMGVGYRTMKSNYDKAVEQNKELNSKLSQLEKQVQDLMLRSTVEDVVKKTYKPQPTLANQYDATDQGLYDDSQTQPQAPTTDIADVLNSFRDTLLREIDSKFEQREGKSKEQVAQIYEEKERDTRIQNELRNIAEADFQALQEDFPDVPENILRDLHRLQEAYSSMHVEAYAEAQKGTGEWVPQFQQLREIDKAIVAKKMEIAKMQQELKDKKERESLIMMTETLSKNPQTASNKEKRDRYKTKYDPRKWESDFEDGKEKSKEAYERNMSILTTKVM